MLCPCNVVILHGSKAARDLITAHELWQPAAADGRGRSRGPPVPKAEIVQIVHCADCADCADCAAAERPLRLTRRGPHAWPCWPAAQCTRSQPTGEA